MFAAQLLIVAGSIGLVFGVLVWAHAIKFDTKTSPVMASLADLIPGWYQTILCAATLVFGIMSLRQHVKTYAILGLITGLLSFGAFGLVPAVMVAVLVMIIFSVREGEETMNDGKTLHPHEWPDKSISASMFLFVAGVAGILQGIAILTDQFQPVTLSGKGFDPFVGSFDIVVGCGALFAALSVFKQKRPWTGWAFGALVMATLAFYAVGPAMGLLALLMMGLAYKEDEFNKHSEEAELGRLEAAAAEPEARPKKKARRATR